MPSIPKIRTAPPSASSSSSGSSSQPSTPTNPSPLATPPTSTKNTTPSLKPTSGKNPPSISTDASSSPSSASIPTRLEPPSITSSSHLPSPLLPVASSSSLPHHPLQRPFSAPHRFSTTTASSSSSSSSSSFSPSPLLPPTHSTSTPPTPNSPTSFTSFHFNDTKAASPTKENVMVAVRVKPLLTLEPSAGWTFQSSQQLTSPKLKKPFLVDSLFEGSTTLPIYTQLVQPLVYQALEGINATIFTYGQTNSGKTYTMMGNPHEKGILPLAIQNVFTLIETMQIQKSFLLRVSYFEIYNETFKDLLQPEKENLSIKEDPIRGVYVYPLKEEIVTSFEQVMQILEYGEANRHISTTDYNEHSSRSHTVFQLIIESKLTSNASSSDQRVRFSFLNLIDLAGSEKANTQLERRKEGAYINRSLLTLGTVISKLTEEKSSFIPYRDSKLTRVLQTSLSGNAKISVICTISSSLHHLEESVSTLQFATRVKKIMVQPSTHTFSEQGLLKQYKHEIEQLKTKVMEMNEIMELEQRTRALEKEKFNEAINQHQLIRNALKQRIDHLSRLILTSGGVTNSSSLDSSPSISPVNFSPLSISPALPMESAMDTSWMQQQQSQQPTMVDRQQKIKQLEIVVQDMEEQARQRQLHYTEEVQHWKSQYDQLLTQFNATEKTHLEHDQVQRMEYEKHLLYYQNELKEYRAKLTSLTSEAKYLEQGHQEAMLQFLKDNQNPPEPDPHPWESNLLSAFFLNKVDPILQEKDQVIAELQAHLNHQSRELQKTKETCTLFETQFNALKPLPLENERIVFELETLRLLLGKVNYEKGITVSNFNALQLQFNHELQERQSQVDHLSNQLKNVTQEKLDGMLQLQTHLDSQANELETWKSNYLTLETEWKGRVQEQETNHALAVSQFEKELNEWESKYDELLGSTTATCSSLEEEKNQWKLKYEAVEQQRRDEQAFHEVMLNLQEEELKGWKAKVVALETKMEPSKSSTPRDTQGRADAMVETEKVPKEDEKGEYVSKEEVMMGWEAKIKSLEQTISEERQARVKLMEDHAKELQVLKTNFNESLSQLPQEKNNHDTFMKSDRLLNSTPSGHGPLETLLNEDTTQFNVSLLTLTQTRLKEQQEYEMKLQQYEAKLQYCQTQLDAHAKLLTTQEQDLKRQWEVEHQRIVESWKSKVALLEQLHEEEQRMNQSLIREQEEELRAWRLKVEVMEMQLSSFSSSSSSSSSFSLPSTPTVTTPIPTVPLPPLPPPSPLPAFSNFNFESTSTTLFSPTTMITTNTHTNPTCSLMQAHELTYYQTQSDSFSTSFTTQQKVVDPFNERAHIEQALQQGLHPDNPSQLMELDVQLDLTKTEMELHQLRKSTSGLFSKPLGN